MVVHFLTGRVPLVPKRSGGRKSGTRFAVSIGKRVHELFRLFFYREVVFLPGHPWCHDITQLLPSDPHAIAHFDREGIVLACIYFTGRAAHAHVRPAGHGVASRTFVLMYYWNLCPYYVCLCSCVCKSLCVWQ